VREQTAGLVRRNILPRSCVGAGGGANKGQIKTTQDLSTLIRDLQELWLFGGLDTLSDPADEKANREKAVMVAEVIEGLAGSRKVGGGGETEVEVEIKKEG
jgi:hypothetical protein